MFRLLGWGVYGATAVWWSPVRQDRGDRAGRDGEDFPLFSAPLPSAFFFSPHRYLKTPPSPLTPLSSVSPSRLSPSHLSLFCYPSLSSFPSWDLNQPFPNRQIGGKDFPRYSVSVWLSLQSSMLRCSARLLASEVRRRATPSLEGLYFLLALPST